MRRLILSPADGCVTEVRGRWRDVSWGTLAITEWPGPLLGQGHWRCRVDSGESMGDKCKRIWPDVEV